MDAQTKATLSLRLYVFKIRSNVADRCAEIWTFTYTLDDAFTNVNQQMSAVGLFGQPVEFIGQIKSSKLLAMMGSELQKDPIETKKREEPKSTVIAPELKAKEYGNLARLLRDTCAQTDAERAALDAIISRCG